MIQGSSDFVFCWLQLRFGVLALASAKAQEEGACPRHGYDAHGPVCKLRHATFGLQRVPASRQTGEAAVGDGLTFFELPPSIVSIARNCRKQKTALLSWIVRVLRAEVRTTHVRIQTVTSRTSQAEEPLLASCMLAEPGTWLLRDCQAQRTRRQGQSLTIATRDVQHALI